MDKKELAELVRKLAKIQQELAEIASRLKFIPVSEASTDSDDDEVKAWKPGTILCPHN